VANAAGGALVGFYLAHLATQRQGVDAALVGALGIIINTAELAAALPLGVLADRIAPRVLLVAGAVLGAVGTQLFCISGLVAIFFLSRAGGDRQRDEWPTPASVPGRRDSEAAGAARPGDELLRTGAARWSGAGRSRRWDSVGLSHDGRLQPAGGGVPRC